VMRGMRLGLEGDYGPGAGFFPAVIGTVLAVAAAIWLVTTALGPAPEPPAEFETERHGVGVVVAVVAALIAYGSALHVLGFRLASLLLLLALFFAPGRARWPTKLATAFVASFGVHHVFTEWLRVPLPEASLAPLRALGL
jgi:putative tricarboxylic transport membrane protein